MTRSKRQVPRDRDALAERVVELRDRKKIKGADVMEELRLNPPAPARDISSSDRGRA